MAPDELLKLLRAHSTYPIVDRCLNAIENHEFKHSDGTSLPLARVRQIYSVRARINSELNAGMTAGFDDLLVALNEAPENCIVRLESVELFSKWFTIFSDEKHLVLFGILESPKKKAAWFDPAKEYDD